MRRMFSQKQIESLIQVKSSEIASQKITALLTPHTIDELSQDAQDVLQTAYGHEEGGACSEAIWNEIKALLDKSFIFNFADYNMLKVVDDGNSYLFGGVSTGTGYQIEFSYDSGSDLIYFMSYEV